MGVYDEDTQGKPVYNFSYVDQIYDGLLQNGVRPFIELSFMPKKLAVGSNALHAFWYKPNVAPPKDWNKWDDWLTAFTRHLVERYGERGSRDSGTSKCGTNRTSISGWASRDRSTYFELYDHAVLAVKRVSAQLRVGGPATAQAAWVDAIHPALQRKSCAGGFCVDARLWERSPAQDVFGTQRKDCRATRWCVGR